MKFSVFVLLDHIITSEKLNKSIWCIQIPNYVSISNLADELAKIENEEEEVKFEELDGNDAKTMLNKLFSVNIKNLKFL